MLTVLKNPVLGGSMDRYETRSVLTMF